MKRTLLLLIVVAASLSIYFTSCTDNPTTINSPANNTSNLPCGNIWDLTAGQYTDVGSVEVSNDNENIYVKYTLDYTGAYFGNLHLWIGNNLTLLPSHKNGNNAGVPIPGQFCDATGGACFDATGLTEYTFTIPFSELNITDFASQACGTNLLNLFIFTHAEVKGTLNETAFGGNIGVNIGESGRWYFYSTYTVCCEFGNPGLDNCQTAFAKFPKSNDGLGLGYVFVSQNKANPEGYNKLEMTQNRWGWAMLIEPLPSVAISKTYDIWAGAGLNKTSNGTKVGSLTIDFDGIDNWTITYSMLQGKLLEELHFLVDFNTEKPMTLAPGQFDYKESFDPKSNTGIVNFVTPENANKLWFIAHSVVCW